MKKLQFIAVLILSLFFVLSCTINDDEDLVDTISGDDTDTTEDTLPDNQQDTDTDTSDTDTGTTDTDTDTTDTGAADTDTASDTDTNTDTETDTNTDTETDTDSDTDADTDTAGLPECNYLSGTPCKDKDTGFVWSSTPSGELSWNGAVDYCDKLTEAGLSWRLPEIYELRTLIENCSYTQMGSACQISEDCLSYACNDAEKCASCGIKDGYYSKLNDALMLWSASKVTDYSDYYVWTLNFKYGSFSQGNFNASSDDKYYARCIKK